MARAAQERAFGNEIGWGDRPALLLVDMVDAYFTPGSPLHLPEHSCLAAAERLLRAARERGVPVLHTTVRYRAGLHEAGHFGRKVPSLRIFVDDDPDAGLARTVDALAPLDAESVIVKQYASGFFGTSLAATLTTLRVDTLAIAGVSTSGCVRATTTDALQHGYRPMLVADACGDRTEAIHRSNVRDLRAKYADVVSVEECLDQFGRADC